MVVMAAAEGEGLVCSALVGAEVVEMRQLEVEELVESSWAAKGEGQPLEPLVGEEVVRVQRRVLVRVEQHCFEGAEVGELVLDSESEGEGCSSDLKMGVELQTCD